MNCCRTLLPLLIPFQVFGQEHFLSFLEEESLWQEKGPCKSLRLSFEIERGYYIQADQVLNENFIPTLLVLSDAPAVIHILYPKSQFLLLGEREKVAVFKERLEIWIEFEAPLPDTLERDMLKGSLHYQACNTQKCFFPRSLSFALGKGS
ncbi:MAG: protein-disulfide reductase DsbD domain-containing protein [Bacteroidota bacterium]